VIALPSTVCRTSEAFLVKPSLWSKRGSNPLLRLIEERNINE